MIHKFISISDIRHYPSNPDCTYIKFFNKAVPARTVEDKKYGTIYYSNGDDNTIMAFLKTDRPVKFKITNIEMGVAFMSVNDCCRFMDESVKISINNQPITHEGIDHLMNHTAVQHPIFTLFTKTEYAPLVLHDFDYFRIELSNFKKTKEFYNVKINMTGYIEYYSNMGERKKLLLDKFNGLLLSIK